jgi:hypothetical protein
VTNACPNGLVSFSFGINGFSLVSPTSGIVTGVTTAAGADAGALGLQYAVTVGSTQGQPSFNAVTFSAAAVTFSPASVHSASILAANWCSVSFINIQNQHDPLRGRTSTREILPTR